MKIILLIIAIMAFSANLPAPLFPIYQSHFNFNNFDITALFAIYTACMLPSLLISTSFVKRNGTKNVVRAGIILALISSLIFIFTVSPWMLYLARAVEGAALGLFMGTSNGLLLKHSSNAHKALALSSMATLLGFGFGPMSCGLIGEYSKFKPYTLPYIVLFLLLLLALILLFKIPNINENKDKKAPITFHLGIPKNSKTIFLSFVCPAVFVMLALNGVVISLVPTYVHSILKSSNLSYSGILLFIFLGGGAVSQIIKSPKARTTRVQLGLLLLLIGTWLMVLAGFFISMTLLFIGMIILAIGNGLTFQGTIQLAGSLASKDESAAVISTYYVAGYTGMAIPTIGIGILSTILGLMSALIIFGIIITVIGIILIIIPKFQKKYQVNI